MQKPHNILEKRFAILILVLFSLRPAYYVGQLAYYELNIDTIIEKYCVNKDKPQLACNGKCHLAKQLQIAEPTDDQQAMMVMMEAFFPVFLVTPEPIDFTVKTIPNFRDASFYYQNHYALEWANLHFKPPIC